MFCRMDGVSTGSGAVLFAWALVCAALWIGRHFSRRVSEPRRKTVEEAIESEAEKGHIDPAGYAALHGERFALVSPFGYSLSCEWISPGSSAGTGEGKRRKAMVFVHGYGFNRAGSVKYLRHFLERGFDALLYDHRNSGASGGEHTSMGFFEHRDLSLVVGEARRRVGPEGLVGTHGESMGGATVLLQAATKDAPDFVIADCPYSDLRRQLGYRLRIEHHLPAFPFIPLASLFTKLHVGYFYAQVSPLGVIRDAGGLPDIPILFVHGAADDYVPTAMSRELHAAKRGIAALHVVPGAEHALSIVVDPVGYMKQVDEFLESVV